MSDHARAGLLCVLSCAFFAAANALAKLAQIVSPEVALHSLQVVAARFLVAAVVIAPFALARRKTALRTAQPWRHVQRVALGALGLSCGVAALAAMPLADATAIAWAAPLFAVAFGGVFLRERLGRDRILAALVGFGGVAVMMAPGQGAFQPAALLALGAAVCTGAEVATIRLLATRDAPLSILTINNLLGAALTCSAAAFVFTPPTGPQLAALIGLGVVMVAGQAIFLQASRLAPASVVAPFYYATIVWAALIGVMAFGDVIGWRLLLGAGLVVVAGVYVATRPVES